MNFRHHTACVVLCLAALVLSGCSTSRVAVKDGFRVWLERSYESEMYQQDRVMLIDEQGDALLIRKLDTIVVKLSDAFFHQSLPQAVSDRERCAGDIDFRIGKTNPLDNELLLSQFADVMRQHYPYIGPHLGDEHVWSAEARKYMRYGYWHRLWRKIEGRQQDFPCPLFMRSKLLLCLACGWTSRYCITGKEAALTRRILSYPDRSLQLHQLFAESYVLNQGNLYMTFLTCENVLADHPHRADRENDPLQRKLAYIRNDSKELGDNYGAWYHFFGIALYGMLRPQFVSTLVANIESTGSLFMEGPDRQETYINYYGALFGHSFAKMIKDGSWQAAQ